MERFHPAVVSPAKLIGLMRDWRIPDGANVVMMPARLTRWKGHLVLIEAMALLNREDVVCVMVGSDQGRTGYRAEVEQAVQDKGLEGRVRIVDHCSDMATAYMLAAVIVSASIEPEGFGRVPVEAQAMGRPIVATDHGGAQETILRGETGWLVPPGNAQKLSEAIADALALGPMERAVLASRAMAHVAEHFTKDGMARATLDVYAELLNERHGEKTLRLASATMRMAAE